MKRTMENGERLTKAVAFLLPKVLTGMIQFSKQDSPQRLSLLQVRHCKRTGLVDPGTVNETARLTINSLVDAFGRRDLTVGTYDPVKLLVRPNGGFTAENDATIDPKKRRPA